MMVYITFGSSHTHHVNNKTFDKNCVASINCNSFDEGRDKAFELFGPKFSFFYTSLSQLKMDYFPRGVIPVE